MSYPPHELSNLSFPAKYFAALPADDVSRRFYAGEKYVSSLVSRARIFFSTESYLNELARFYPHHQIITRTREMYLERKQEATNTALTVTAIASVGTYLFAKQGIVAPFFSKFGRFVKGHRLLRHYLWAAAAPYLLLQFQNNWTFLNQVENLWGTHSLRLNQRILTDPQGSDYPRELLPVSQVGTWQMPFISRYDLPKKNANETLIFQAPDYEEIEEWNKVQLTDPDEEEAGEEGGEAEAEAEE